MNDKYFLFYVVIAIKRRLTLDKFVVVGLQSRGLLGHCKFPSTTEAKMTQEHAVS